MILQGQQCDMAVSPDPFATQPHMSPVCQIFKTTQCRVFVYSLHNDICDSFYDHHLMEQST
jgi:hypothetical protein